MIGTQRSAGLLRLPDLVLRYLLGICSDLSVCVVPTESLFGSSRQEKNASW
jgi:hypothetical protein